PVNVGGVRSSVQVAVLVIDDELFQASVAINVLVCDLKHPLEITGASDEVILVTAAQASVAVALPRAAATLAGLQPSGTSAYDPVNVGGVRSSVQVAVLVIDDELLQASVAINVLVCDLKHPLEITGASDEVILVTAAQASVAVALPRAAATLAGLQPSGTSAYDPVNVGGVRSSVQVAVLVIDDELLQASIAINVLVCDLKHPLEITGASDEVILVTAAQASVAVALPRAAATLAGLQPSGTSAYDPVNVGGVRSSVQVAVLVIDDELLQASIAINVLVCDLKHPLEITGASDEVILVTAAQASVAVALPRAAATLAGLQPSGTSAYDPVNVGGVRSSVQVAVLVIDDELLQASIAINVLVCDLKHPLEITGASDEVILVTAAQASVAVALPRAAATLAGLQPSGTSAYDPVNVGGVRSSVQVAVLVIDDELLQASVAINVLVCYLKHPLEITGASDEVILVTGAQASVAVALPRAAATLAGLQPSGTSAYEPVNVGGVRSSVQVAVLVIVDELLQASVAINVLVCDLKHPLEITAPSDEVILVTGAQASVAVALPSAAATLAGLQPSGTSAYEPVNVGGVRSSVQIAVLVIDDELLQASVAINVLVC